jgi:hypothetical protein
MGLCRTRIGSAIAGSFTLRAHTHPKRIADPGTNAHQTSKPPSRKRFSILGCWDDRFLAVAASIGQCVLKRNCQVIQLKRLADELRDSQPREKGVHGSFVIGAGENDLRVGS